MTGALAANGRRSILYDSVESASRRVGLAPVYHLAKQTQLAAMIRFISQIGCHYYQMLPTTQSVVRCGSDEQDRFV